MIETDGMYSEKSSFIEAGFQYLRQF